MMKSTNNDNNAVILLSGGLDSFVALDYVQKKSNINVKLALTFDYGQKASVKEIETTEKICRCYGITHKIIKLGWLKDITNTSLVSDNKIPNDGFCTKESAEAVWVPNRNSLFLSIAGCFCDSLKYKYIVYGANKDEGKTFPDNTENFRKQVSKVFKTSTLVKAEVIAPLINYSKNDIVKIAIEDSVPLELVWSCYSSGDVHCGQCESCNHLKRALIANHAEKYIDILFKNEN